MQKYKIKLEAPCPECGSTDGICYYIDVGASMESIFEYYHECAKCNLTIRESKNNFGGNFGEIPSAGDWAVCPFCHRHFEDNEANKKAREDSILITD